MNTYLYTHSAVNHHARLVESASPHSHLQSVCKLQNEPMRGPGKRASPDGIYPEP